MKRRKYTYPPVSQWRKVSSQFEWVDDLKNGEMVIVDDEDGSLHIVVKNGGQLRQHAFIRNQPRPEGFSLVHREKYPPVSQWRTTKDFSVKLDNGEYTIIVHPPTGKGHYIIARIKGELRVYPYLQYGKFKEDGFKHVSRKEE